MSDINSPNSTKTMLAACKCLCEMTGAESVTIVCIKAGSINSQGASIAAAISLFDHLPTVAAKAIATYVLNKQSSN